MSRAIQPPMDLGSWIARRAAATPHLPAITFHGQTWTYRQFADRLDRLAAELAAGGVGRGDRVGYLGLNHPDLLTTLFAAARIGATFVPLNWRLTGTELSYIVSNAGVHTLLADPVYPTPDEVAVIMYTSGTTGRPKGAMLTHGNLFWNNMSYLLAFDISQHDVSLVCAPMFHIGGLNVTTLVTLHKGGHIVLMSTFDAGEALKLIPEYQITTMFGVPAMFLFMSQLPEFAATDLSSLRYLICGGAPVPEALIKLYSERGIPFAEGYGLTETAPFALILRTDEVTRKIGAAGHQVTQLSDVRLVDLDNRPVPAGERGEVCVRGPQVTVGYWRNPEATAAAFDADGWFHTGDIGQADDDGYVWVIDRVKDMVISGGENVYPAEVEDVLYHHPAIAEVAVVGTPHERWGEAVTAVVVLRPGATLTLAELRDFARDKLAAFKIPLRLEFIDALPRTQSGKVVKYQLRELLSSHPRSPI